VWKADLSLLEKAHGLAISSEPKYELAELEESKHENAYFSLSTRGSSMTA